MNIRKILNLQVLLLFALITMLTSGCNDSGGGGGDNPDPGDNGNSQSVKLKLDLSSSKGAVVTDGSTNAYASVAAKHLENALYLGIEPKISVVNSPLFSGAGSTGATFYKVDADGNVSPAIEGDCDNAAEMAADSTVQCIRSGIQVELPQVKHIGINGDQVYFLFAYNFIYRDLDDDGALCQNPWEWGSPCSCQIFKAKDALTALKDGSVTPALDNLECVDNYNTINWWGPTSHNPFQFDGAGNMYYYGQLPDSSQQVLYKVDKEKDADGKFVKAEIVNANICVRDYRVTQSGGLFYIGENCIDGQWGGGDGSFFRYVGSDGSLKQISNGWWEYIFEPIEGQSSDKVLFYGPDPDSAEVAQWNSACLYEWDPSLPAGSRATRMVTCDNHIWEWLEVRRSADLPEFANASGEYFERWRRPDAADEVEDGTNTSPYTRFLGEFRRRCAVGNSETFIGGGSGLPVKNVKQTSTGEAFIVANVNLKNSGTFGCNVSIRGPHCSINNNPALKNTGGDYSKATCVADGGTWITKGWCSGGFSPWLYQDDIDGCVGAGNSFTYSEWGDWYDSILYKPDEISSSGNITGHICVDELDNPTGGVSKYKTRNDWETVYQVSGNYPTLLEYSINNVDCKEPSAGWTTTYKGMAYVDRTTNQLTLRSDTAEQVADMWLVNDEFYYTAFNTSLGQYVFIKENASVANDSLLADFEVYHVEDSPKAGRVMFDGLDFSNNSYIFGDLDPAAADVAASIVKTVGLTGRVQTMVTYH
jgi:hypothetical protein